MTSLLRRLCLTVRRIIRCWRLFCCALWHALWTLIRRLVRRCIFGCFGPFGPEEVFQLSSEPVRIIPVLMGRIVRRWGYRIVRQPVAYSVPFWVFCNLYFLTCTCPTRRSSLCFFTVTRVSRRWFERLDSELDVLDMFWTPFKVSKEYMISQTR